MSQRSGVVCCWRLNQRSLISISTSCWRKLARLLFRVTASENCGTETMLKYHVLAFPQNKSNLKHAVLATGDDEDLFKHAFSSKLKVGGKK